MAFSSFHHLLLISTILILVAATIAAASSQPKALVIPLTRDVNTLQQIIKLNQRTPPVTIPLTIDLQGEFLWLDCDQVSKSSTNRRIHCDSARCALANSNSNIPRNLPYKPCNIVLTNPVTNVASIGELYADVVRINSTDGTNPVRVVSVPRFSYGCEHNPLLQRGLAKGVKGIAGLGRTKASLPSQFSSYFKFVNKFAICVSSILSDGFLIFGDKPYNLLPKIEISTLLTYTPLLTNPTVPSTYYINVTSVKIDQTEAKFDNSLLTINAKGIGGTKISTTTPYTIMQSSILKAVTSAFVAQVERPGSFAKRVKAIAPFTVCYAVGSLPFTMIGVIVPDINLVMEGGRVVWTISGTNSMVTVDSISAYCFGFVDGGPNPEAAIVIGSYQLENNLLQFDLVNSKLGFTSNSLLFSRNRCDSFNFTSA